MTVCIVHGIQGYPGIHWQQWLHDELQAVGHSVLMPAMPNPEHPDREQWLQTLADAVADERHNDLTFVGHSLGVTTILDYLQAGPAVKSLVSVSGFARDYGNDLNSYFLQDRSIDMSAVRRHIGVAHVVFGDDDPYVSQNELRWLADELGCEPTVICGGGHLNTDGGYTEFPELNQFI